MITIFSLPVKEYNIEHVPVKSFIPSIEELKRLDMISHNHDLIQQLLVTSYLVKGNESHLSDTLLFFPNREM